MSHPLDEPSTGSGAWLLQPGPIELRHTERKPTPTEGVGLLRIVLGVAIVLIFGYLALHGWLG